MRLANTASFKVLTVYTVPELVTVEGIVTCQFEGDETCPDTETNVSYHGVY